MQKRLLAAGELLVGSLGILFVTWCVTCYFLALIAGGPHSYFYTHLPAWLQLPHSDYALHAGYDPIGGDDN